MDSMNYDLIKQKISILEQNTNFYWEQVVQEYKQI